MVQIFVTDQKFIYILWQSQTFYVRQGDDLHSVKLFICSGTKVFEEALNAVKLDLHKTLVNRIKKFYSECQYLYQSQVLNFTYQGF